MKQIRQNQKPKQDEKYNTRNNTAIIAVIVAIIFIMMSTSGHAQTPTSNTALLSVSALNQDPNPARAGDVVTLRFQVQNLGNLPANDVKLNLINDYPFTSVNDNGTQYIQSIAQGQQGDNSVNIQFTVKIDKDAIRGTYPIKLRYQYNGGAIQEFSTDVNLENNVYAQIIYVDKSLLSPGRETSMNFTITNVGSAPLQNLVFSWNEPTGAILPVYSDDTRYIKYLDVGQSVVVNYIVIADVNAKPGLYQLNMNLKYQPLSNTTATQINTKAGVFVGGYTDFDVTFSESTQGQTSLSVANTGNNPASSVSVKIPDQPYYTVSGSSASIIGNLDKGDYTLVSFQIVARGTGSNFTRGQGSQRNTSFNFQGAGAGEGFNASALANRDLQVIIQYTDTTGQRVSIQKSVPIQFRSATTSTGSSGNFSGRSGSTSFIGSTTFWIIIGVVVVGAVYLIFFRPRRIQKKKGKFD